MLVNRRPDQRRVVLIESGVTTELFFERTRTRSVVGNVYLGRVVRVLPGMQAAFIDIGLSRSGFLFVGDVVRPTMDESASADKATGDSPQPPGRGDRYPPIATLINQGQPILVQVSKAPIGTKGARLTTHISLPGRHLVYMPNVLHLGVSRRITDEVERERLRTLLQRIRPPNGGLIVRTVGEGLVEADFRDDLTFLSTVWSDVQRRAKVAEPPSLIHEEIDLTLRSVRDLLNSPFDRVVVDDDSELQRIRTFVQRFMPDVEASIERWDSDEPMLDRYGVEWEITRASRRKVWLKSGGYILIERTEALTAIDVNSGRNVGKQNLEETILDINLEAAKEIAYQLRLRDIGGIIVIDFIDMLSPANRRTVYESLTFELQKDRARTKVSPVSEIGLVEMTRKRVRDSIVHELTEPCFYCEGKGYLRSVQIVCDSIMFSLHQQLRGTVEQSITVTAHPRVVELMADSYQDELTRLEQRVSASVALISRDDLHIERFHITRV